MLRILLLKGRPKKGSSNISWIASLRLIRLGLIHLLIMLSSRKTPC